MMKKMFTFFKTLYIPKCCLMTLVLGICLFMQWPQIIANKNMVLQDEIKQVTGTVTDANTGEPLPGVSIQVKGRTTGTVTDINGKYTLSISPKDVLIFSYVGYLNEEVVVGEQTEINLKLVPDIIGLEEVVVLGYGVQKKKLVTGATVQVKNEDLLKNNVTRLESSLQGLTPGLVIVKKSGQPGSDFNINIRGIGSVNGSTPLVLVDGVPGDINLINPSDVETVDVLKDAASAAIYGARGADGVILVTTKKGKTGVPQLTYDFYYGISNAPRKIDMLNAQEYAMIMNEQYRNVYPTGTKIPFPQEKLDSINNLGHEGTDWQEEAYHKNAPIQSHYLGLTGGNENSTYSISLSYLSEDGIFDYKNKSNFKRLGFRINSDHKVNKFIRIGENLTYAHRKRRGLGVGNIYDNFLRTLLSASPLIDVYDPNEPDGFGRSHFFEEQLNPIAVMNYYYNSINKYDDIIGDVYVELEFINGLKFKTDFGGSIFFEHTSSATDTFTITSQNYNHVPDYRQYMERRFSYNWDNILSYEKTIGKHNLLAMVAMNVQDNWRFYEDINANAFLIHPNLDPVISNIFLQTDIVGDTVYVKGDYGKTDSRYSYLGRLSYNYDEQFLVTLSYRRDGSSRFGKNYRYGNFYSVSGGWVVTRANYLVTPAWLDFLKIRGSWGQNGKEPNMAGRALATVGSSQRSYSFGNGWETGISPDVMPNPNLRWEASEQINVGFDARFLRSLSFTFDWYKKTSKDWIVPTTVAGISGIEGISSVNPYINGGNVKNSGVEFELGYIKNIGIIRLDLRGNMAYNKNEVTNVPGKIIHGSNSVLFNGSEEFYRVQEGYPIGYFWGYKTDGLFQSAEEIQNYKNSEGKLLQPSAKPGDVKRVDLNGDGVLNDKDKTMIGDPNPDYIYGLSINAAAKGFDFSINFQGVAGNQVVMCYRDEARTYYNYTSDILDRWQWVDKNQNGVVEEGEGTSNTIPRVTGGLENNNNWRKFSDLYIHDAGFLKIKSINLGYDFAKLTNKFPVKQFRVYLSATNLLTLTKYKGLDPEVGYGSYYDSSGRLVDAYASGVDLGFYPSARTYLIGLNVKF